MKCKMQSASKVSMFTAVLRCEEHGANLSKKSVMCIIKGSGTITDTSAIYENELAPIYIVMCSSTIIEHKNESVAKQLVYCSRFEFC